MSVSYVDLLGSPTYSGNISEASFTSTGEIPGSCIDQLYMELFPPPANGVVPLPKTCPGSSQLYAYNMNVEPLFSEQVNNNPGDTFNTYDTVKATVTWKNIAYLQYNNSLITRRMRMGGKFLELPNTFLQWADTGKPVTNPEVKYNLNYSLSDCEIKIHRSPTNPTTAFIAAGGCCNASPFMGSPTGCLLFNGADDDELVTPYGSTAYDITLKCTMRIIGGDSTIDWNYVYDDDAENNGANSGWKKLKLANGSYPAPYVNFESLIP
jgi:hypothetical protein